MNTRQTAWVAIATLTAAALGFAGARAMATGAPQLSPLTYGGVLTDKDGKPYPSAQEVVLKFYDKVDATAPKCTAPAAQAEAGSGRFSVVLPGECAQAVRDTPDLWSEATVGGGKTVLPRVHVGAVPYALEADSAKVAAGATGALKAAMDGVAADVAALKAAGPWVEDAAGTKLGKLLSVDLGFTTASGEMTDSGLIFMTTTGYVIHAKGGSFPSDSLYFAASNCAGAAAALSVTGGQKTLDHLAYWSSLNSKFYVPDSGVSGYAVSNADKKVVSAETLAACKNLPGTGFTLKSAISLHAVDPVDIGLPATISFPVQIQP